MDNWYSTDMSIRGKIIDGTKLDGFLLQENNTIIGLITYTFFGDICEIVSLDSKKENVGIGSALDEVRKVKPDVPLLGDNDIPLRDEIRISLHRH
ncbi:MAG: hypothetical protein IJH12_05305 [Clostridia bacterium]|nr:hypothetical protein [Clostridia bacterium]